MPTTDDLELVVKLKEENEKLLTELNAVKSTKEDLEKKIESSTTDIQRLQRIIADHVISKETTFEPAKPRSLQELFINEYNKNKE